MFTAERRQAIVELVRANGAVSLRELAESTDSSEVTVRRDVRALEEQGVLDRRRGGAVWPGGLSHEQSYRQKRAVASAEKAAIAVAAAGLVEEGDAIVVGGGSTTQEFARRLARIVDLTVVTNSVLVAQALSDAKAEVVLTGGSLRKSTHALIGSGAEKALAGLRVRRAFLSGNGLTVERGLSTPNMHVASIDQAIMHSAQEVVVLADHTKLGVDTMFQTVPTERIGLLVTDAAADPALLEAFRGDGVEIVVAAPGAPGATGAAAADGIDGLVAARAEPTRVRNDSVKS
ncbi:transcriptional regulator, DeoR family [Jatrophihabitans endophyticus]|uniref:Transcriptional regulator, DeoR family n=1 Tax=Jatrophihabitans endophyticus TaxID=1206085 RepID=A0A1M5PCM4_9ACTN|nr:DeoR/GlpR family DNA-binding transcription regulator [Jatrophihabitans endophyticus]SHG99003.1 transcriptional regulator, DeoR family [Jatrophihabitans endophyticus]